MLSSLKNRRKGNPFFLHRKRNAPLLFHFHPFWHLSCDFSNLLIRINPDLFRDSRSTLLDSDHIKASRNGKLQRLSE